MLSEHKDTLKEVVAKAFNAIIWQIKTDNNGRLMAIEVRNPDTRTAEFTLLDFESGETLFENIAPEGSWLLSLDTIHSNVVFLHGYQHAEIPVRRGITAIDSKGSIVWQSYNKNLTGLTASSLLAEDVTISPARQVLLDPATGNTLNEKTTAELAPASLYFPEPEDNTPEIVNLLSEGQELTGPVQKLEYNEHLFYGFHVKMAGKINEYFAAFQQNNLYHLELIDRDIRKLNPEPFFIQHNRICLIRNNKQEIVIYLV